MSDVETFIPSPELLLSERTGDELDYEAARAVGGAHLFRVALKEIDEDLDLLWAKPGAKSLQGGYWYIWRRNPSGSPSFWQVCDDDGSYCDPDQRHLDHMMRIDSARNPKLYAQYSARRERRRERKRQEIRERHREFREKLLERLDHLYRPTIAVTAAMKAKADGKAVTAGGVVLPDAIDRTMMRAAREKAAQGPGAPTTPPTPRNGGDGVELAPGPVTEPGVPGDAGRETGVAA